MPADPWSVFDYEVNQLRAMCTILRSDNPVLPLISQQVRNALVESALIHTRILTQILISEGWPDDIKLRDLLPSFGSENIDGLRDAYGTNDDPTSPRRTINKRLAHPSNERSDSHDYSNGLMTLLPIIEGLVQEIATRRSSA